MLPRLPHLRPLRTLARTYTTTSTTNATTNPRPKARITEVGPRDGLQNEPRPIPLSTKLSLLSRLSHTGLTHIEAGSFVSPKWVPQMSDSGSIASLLSTQHNEHGVRWSYLVPNMKGMESALEYKVPEIAVFLSASEGFSRKNLNCSITESFDKVVPVVAAAKAAGIPVRGYVSMVVDCPYSGATPPQMVLKVAEKLLEMGCYEVSLGDTVGRGTVESVGSLLRCLKEEGGLKMEEMVSVHFHDTFGMGVANVAEAIRWGVRGFDGSVAGLGGCPYAKGATGNVATEDLVWFLEGAGFDTGVNLTELAKIGEWISTEIGRRNESRVGKAILSKLAAMAEKGEKEAVKSVRETPRAVPVAA